MDSLASRFTFRVSRAMSRLARRIRWLFGATRGLLLVATAWDALLVALLSPFSGSGPLARLDLPSRLVVDRLGVRGFLRRSVGWGVLVGSTLAFVSVQFYMYRQPGREVGWAVPFLDAGLALFLVMLAVFLSVQLVGMISREGGVW
jgi:hypothetical protein